MVVSAAEKGFTPLSEPETEEEIDKLNLFIRKNKLPGSEGELSKIDKNKVLESFDIVPSKEEILDLEAISSEEDIEDLGVFWKILKRRKKYFLTEFLRILKHLNLLMKLKNLKK